ncbi:VOC family protein [Virgibacillus sp. DJP39]|uniref:VOC family protein n=1 Tax=Virgibacillus sp. DJP39 TaxID=3409790 RepID=UPI003BB65787
MKRILPHIYLENCKEALNYYQEVFDGEIKNIQMADGMEMFKGHEGKYIHAELHINALCIIYFADIFGDQQTSENIWLMIDIETEDEINNLYDTLINDGKIKMELQDTFWGSRYAVVTDKFGLTWELNLQK